MLGCDSNQARYDDAVDRLARLEADVDALFARAQAGNAALFGKDQWQDRDRIISALTDSIRAMSNAEAKQRQRITLEEEIMGFEFLADSAETRLLYRLDLDSQQAKLTVFTIALEMYQKLLPEARANNRTTYEELAQVYSRGIAAANQRYKELDLLRQTQQKALHPVQPAPV